METAEDRKRTELLGEYDILRSEIKTLLDAIRLGSVSSGVRTISYQVHRTVRYIERLRRELKDA